MVAPGPIRTRGGGPGLRGRGGGWEAIIPRSVDTLCLAYFLNRDDILVGLSEFRALSENCFDADQNPVTFPVPSSA